MTPVLVLIEAEFLGVRVADESGNTFDAHVPIEFRWSLRVGEETESLSLDALMDLILSEEDRAFLDGVVESGIRDWIAGGGEDRAL